MYDKYIDRPIVRLLHPLADQVDRVSGAAWPLGRVMLLAPMAIAMKNQLYEVAALLLLILHVADRLHMSLRPTTFLSAQVGLHESELASTVGGMRFTLTVLAGKGAIILSLWTVLLLSHAPIIQSVLLWSLCISLMVFESAHAVGVVMEHVDLSNSIRSGAEPEEASRRAQPAIETTARQAMEILGIALLMMSHRSFSPLTTVGTLLYFCGNCPRSTP